MPRLKASLYIYSLTSTLVDRSSRRSQVLSIANKGIAGILKFEMDTNLLEDCHKNDDAISELTEEQHESEEQQHDDFQDDDQFDTYLMPEDSMAGDGEDI